MKILLFSFYYTPDLCAGSFRMAALVEQLRQLPDVELEIITTMPNRYSTFKSKALPLEKEKNLTIHRVPLPSHKSGMLDQIKAFYTYFKAAIQLTKGKEYNLVFGTSSRLFTAFLSAWVAKSKKLPLYLDVRDIFVDTIKDILSPKIVWFMKPVLSLVEKYAFHNAQHINLVSEGFKSYFEKRYPKPVYSYFTNGIDSEFLNKSNSLSKTEKGKTINVLYAGNIGEGQGLQSIIPALAKDAGERYQFKIIGDGGRKAQLQEACSEINNVSLAPPVSRQELVDEYLAADVLFLHLNDYPAFKKVLPSKLFEYGAIGKPILAGVQGYAAKFLNEHMINCEVFMPNDSKQGVEALLALEIKNTERPDFIQKFARTNIMKEMSVSIVATGRS